MERLNVTEERNLSSYGIDRLDTEGIFTVINNEDKSVPYAVEKAKAEICYVVDRVTECFRNNGRLFYIGAGTSGRLGVLDASECHPTYGVPYEMVQGIIAGGAKALTTSIEGAEDDREAGVAACKDRNITKNDVLIGITANGGAPFVVAALEYANSLGTFTAAISCNEKTAVFNVVEKRARIYLPVGPEIITGSTRMKAGTAQKLTLNLITTISMIKLGKVYNNLMVDLLAVNAKLVKRSINIIKTITGLSDEKAKALFDQSNGNTKVAIVMGALEVDATKARQLLEKEDVLGRLFERYNPVNLTDEFR